MWNDLADRVLGSRKCLAMFSTHVDMIVDSPLCGGMFSLCAVSFFAIIVWVAVLLIGHLGCGLADGTFGLRPC